MVTVPRAFKQLTDINYSEPKNITDLLKRNRRRLQRGKLIEKGDGLFCALLRGRILR
jgi:hypothetical protein